MKRWMIGLLFLAVSLRAQDDFFIGVRNTSIEKDRVEIYWNNLFRSLEVKAEGTIALSDDDREVASIQPDGYLIITERSFFKTRELTVRPGADGQLERIFKIGNYSAEYDGYAKNWLADILPSVVAYTGLGAERRIQKLIERRGIEAAIRELNFLETNAAKAMYFYILIEQPELDAALLQKTVDKMAESISSSTKLKEILVETAKKYPQDSVLTTALINATSEITSSSAHKEALIEIARLRPLNIPSAVAIAESVEDIASSSAQKDALEALAELAPSGEEVWAAYTKAVRRISSSTAQQDALLALIRRRELSDRGYIELFKTVEHISSSSAQGEILVKAVEKCSGSDDVLEAYLRAVSSVSSSSVQGRALMAMLAKPGLSQAVLSKTIHVAKSEISSKSVEEEVKDRAYELMMKK